MTLANLRQALLENNIILLDRLTFPNEKILKRFSVDKDGNILYNGSRIVSDISDDAYNAIEVRTNGLYVDGKIIGKFTDDNGTLLYDGKRISSAVSQENGNIIEEKQDGLYVPEPPATDISKDSDNAIEEKTDGLFVKKVEIKVSSDSGNAIEQKSDGLFVKKVDETKVSSDSDNAIEQKADGLYVKKISEAKVSSSSGNAIEQKADGIYVKDQDGAVQQLQQDSTKLKDDINIFSKYQKYLNTELEYCFCSLDKTPGETRSRFIISPASRIPFHKIHGNMEVGTNGDGFIKLQAGKTYCINWGVSIQDVNNAYITAELHDATHTLVLQHANIFSANAPNTPNNDSDKAYIYTPEEDCVIGVYITSDISVNWNNKIYLSVIHNRTYIAVHEIGREIVIDPVEYVNDQQGLEDTPVGHILSYMGNIPPKHYLNCDGTVYDILSYPMLANHIREQFGSFNFFGGDGVNTFAVPDLRGEFLRGTGTNGHVNQGSGDAVGTHKDATIFPNVQTTTGGDVLLAGYQNSSNYAVMGNADYVYKAANTAINRTSVNSTKGKDSGSLGYVITKYTSRPTNTSVMYCIKYEPTYYFQHTTSVTENVVKEITQVQEISSLDYLEKHADLEGVPVGHILSYMGNTPPKHYLNCDGTVYNISDYQYLAEHINVHFGKYNYFGGNGTSTFAVPDLRGEFLRGTGKKGSSVGIHQNGTSIPSMYQYGNVFGIYHDKKTANMNIQSENIDDAVLPRNYYTQVAGSIQSCINDRPASFTLRPTNTSVMYCIKYEPTYYFENNEHEHDNKNILDNLTDDNGTLLYNGKKISVSEDKVSDDDLQKAIRETLAILNDPDISYEDIEDEIQLSIFETINELKGVVT